MKKLHEMRNKIVKLSRYALSAEYDGGMVTVSAGGMRYSYPASELNAVTKDCNSLSCPYLSVGTANGEVRAFDCIGLYETENASLAFPLGTRHIKVRTVDFIDRTDAHDALVNEQTRTVYHRAGEKFHASLYIVTDLLSKVSLVILGDAPYYNQTELEIKNETAFFDGSGWGAFYGMCMEGGESDLVRAYYRSVYKGVPRFCMSNTWGDRSCGNTLCTEFIRGELDCAAELGVDIVQIDDGWQEGMTYDASNNIWDNGRSFPHFSDEFWKLNSAKFPEGLQPLAAYALEKGVRMGIWFGPCTYNGGERLHSDLEIIRHFYDDWDVRYVKIDLVELAESGGHTREECISKYLDFLGKVSEIGTDRPRVSGDPRSFPLQFNLDITACDRLGYFAGKQYGTLFVENRYSDFHSYYPHNTLKNLWQLSRWIPADKFQFELLNPRRNTDKYEGDPLGPDNYDMDYLFAAVMVSNPLVWMEMQHLAPKDADALKKIISVWKSVRKDFDGSVVNPIGDCPDGTSFTGFHIAGEEKEYLLLFREYDVESRHTVRLPVRDGEWTLLASNTDASCRADNGVITADIGKPFGYALFSR